jgi:hypothetical protein
VKEDYGKDAIAVHPGKYGTLSLCQVLQPEQEYQIEKKNDERPDETPFLTNRTENKICCLFGYKFELGLGSLKKTFTGKATGTY